ncbi:MAG: Hg(II)-responsive transcriptional regulator [Halieaceae bacterium]|nr:MULTISPECIES: Hg(II)-responsive transcriptional regulator [Haliea]MCR9184773.1 Hg(II)-responsive transcriptional regulator [Halieaceae bacterium]
MVSGSKSMTIGSLGKAAEINLETIRYYQRLGLMTEPDKPLGGIRRYDEDALARLRFIRRARWLGFSLEEIGELLKLEDGTHCDEAKALAERKLCNVRGKIHSLQRIEGVLDRLVEECCTQKDNVTCPLIASLHQGFEAVTP